MRVSVSARTVTCSPVRATAPAPTIAADWLCGADLAAFVEWGATAPTAVQWRPSVPTAVPWGGTAPSAPPAGVAIYRN